jgi:3-oxoacyl-[acyl-carrier protein] reductase
VIGVTGGYGLTCYSAAKAGIIGLTKSLAKEMARYQVSVNAIAPGYIETDMTAGISDKIRETIVSHTLKGRLGHVEEVANVVAFLCSKESGYITGSVMDVSGGFSM